MATALNPYASSAYSEHPIALWSLDDPIYYLSLINDSQRLFDVWSLDNADVVAVQIPDSPSPFANSDIYSEIQVTTVGDTTVVATSPQLFSSSDIDLSIKTFCVNLFLYINPTYLQWMRVGYQYLDSNSQLQKRFSAKMTAPAAESWVNLNKSFTLPTSWQGDIQIILELAYADSGSDFSSKKILMNGLSVGQNSESTCFVSLGSEPVSIPPSSGLQDAYGVSSDQYGVLSDNAYFIVKNNALLANNASIPIVFGTDNSTIVKSQTSNTPSIIFPGKGMLNEQGRRNTYTLEFWMQIDPLTATAKKIIGPLSSNDGIYVKEGFISIRIGQNVASHFVSEWYRPMLVHFIIKDNVAILVINGEQVCSIPYNASTAELPNEIDWWGVYSYSDIDLFKIDCISIYPYAMASIAAKRRFARGQATPSAQFLDSGYLGTPTTIDFSTANYGPSVLYPDIARWDAGYFNNLNATKDYLSVPQYSLPTISIGNATISEWYADNLKVNNIEYPTGTQNPKFFTFRPSVNDLNEWDPFGNGWTDSSYLNFDSIAVLNDQLSSIYAVMQIEENIATKRTLLKFVNGIDGSNFEIYVNGEEVFYTINNQELYSYPFLVGDFVAVGINFEFVSNQFGYEISRFFASPSSIQMFVGGDGSNTFEGKIFRVGFSNQTNFEEIADYFDTNGIVISSFYELLLDHYASYTIIPEIEYSNFFLDISVSSQWEEYFPLSYFGTYVKDVNGNLVYDLDFLQINIGYPSVTTSDVWQYNQLSNEFVGQDYSDLANSVYYNYYSLKRKNTTGSVIDTSKSSLQGYFTFQNINEINQKTLNDFPFLAKVPNNSVIDATQQPNDPYLTKYLFKDNVIVYPPTTTDFNDIAIVISLQIKQRSILAHPLKIKSLQIASRSMNYDNALDPASQRTPIGTKFGTKLYPLVEHTDYVSYKEKNPISIYKTNTPYLYTTRRSGIQVLDQSNAGSKKAVRLPINEVRNRDFKISAFQMWMCYTSPEEININEITYLLKVKHKNGYFIIGGKPIDSQGEYLKLSAYKVVGEVTEIIDGGSSSTTMSENIDSGLSNAVFTSDIDAEGSSFNQIDSNIMFYQNGRMVSSPVIKKNEWACIGIQALEELDFSEFSGEIDIYADALYNNLSYYLSGGLGRQTSLIERTWLGVLEPDSIPAVWSFWSDDNKTWRYVYVLDSSTTTILSPKNIFEAYTGTNRVVVDDSLGVLMNKFSVTSFSDVSWQSYLGKPV